MKKQKIIMVDMSATIIHHGHIRILKYANKRGRVIVALTSDEEIKKIKNLNLLWLLIIGKKFCNLLDMLMKKLKANSI